MIIAKGQGNFESLNGTTNHKNLFYLFLCKCSHFMNTFGVAQNEMVLIKTKYLDISPDQGLTIGKLNKRARGAAYAAERGWLTT